MVVCRIPVFPGGREFVLKEDVAEVLDTLPGAGFAFSLTGLVPNPAGGSDNGMLLALR